MNSKPAALGLVVLAVALLVVAYLYYVGDLQLFTTGPGKHGKHAILAAGLAVVSLVAANFVRPKAMA